MLQAEKQLKQPLPELEAVRNWQGALRYLWDWYVEVSINTPLTFTELRNWSELTCRNLTAFEASVLIKLDLLNRQS